MRNLLLCLCTIFFVSMPVNAGNGLISVKSNHAVKATTDRLVDILTAQGMTVFSRIDHAAGAVQAGDTLRPTELVIFGNPKAGTALMKCGHSVAIDLPLKALVREDEAGQVWLSYNDPEYLAARHSILDCDALVENMRSALGGLVQQAVQP